jgi:hypothetical protein
MEKPIDSTSWMGFDGTRYELIVSAKEVNPAIKMQWLQISVRALRGGTVFTAYKTQKEFFEWLVGGITQS